MGVLGGAPAFPSFIDWGINQTEVLMCACQGMSTPDQDVLRRQIAKRAALLVAALPDDLSLKAVSDDKAAAFLRAAREFAVECTFVPAWGEAEAEHHGRALDLTLAAFELGSGVAAATADHCGRVKQTCVRRCDEADGGYFCYFDCRLEYFVCLASVVLSRTALQ
jgi:pantoate kinase